MKPPSSLVSRLGVGLLAVAGILASACEPTGLRCVPGASVACHCGASRGRAMCEPDGFFGACNCASSCRDETILACTCDDGRLGLQSCLAEGARTACTCEARCIEGATGRCPCGSGLEGRVTCEDGALSACDCSAPRCSTGGTLWCTCPGDGRFSVRRCSDGVYGSCECELDASVVPPRDAGPPAPSCASCGCPTPSTPTPHEGLPPAGSWAVTLDSQPLVLEAREDGYVIVTRVGVRVLARDGTELRAYTHSRDVVTATVLDEGEVVLVDGGWITVLSRTLEPRAQHPLRESCIAAAGLGCQRVLCANEPSPSREYTLYDLASGASRTQRLFRSARMLERVPGQDLVIATDPSGSQELLLVPREGPILSREIESGPPFTVTGWPDQRLVTGDGLVLTLTTCTDPATFDVFGPCAARVGALSLGSRLPMDADVAGFLYVVAGHPTEPIWTIARHDVGRGAQVSADSTSIPMTDRPRQLVHDAWGQRVVLVIDRCRESCTLTLTTAAYTLP